MKRLHVHVTVKDLETSIGFYRMLFGEAPTVIKDDYAKWMLDDPRVNFAISTSGSEAAGFNHLGIQVDSESELTDIAGRLKAAKEQIVEQQDAECCHAVSDKAWVADPVIQLSRNIVVVSLIAAANSRQVRLSGVYRRLAGFRLSENFRLSLMRRLSLPERLSGPTKSMVTRRLSPPNRLSRSERRDLNLPLEPPPLSSAIRNSSSGASAI